MVKRLDFSLLKINWDDFKKPSIESAKYEELKFDDDGNVVEKFNKDGRVILPKVAARGTWGAAENQFFNTKVSV